MAEIDGGGLHFKSVMDNDQMNAAIEETMRRVQGLSDGTVAGGKAMDNAFNTTADNIRKTLSDIGEAIYTHEQELQSLESEYESLGAQASKAFMSGRDDEFRAITQQQNAIKGEITVRQQLIKELQEQSNKLEDSASKMEENANAQTSMRTRIRELREEMMLLVDQGIDEQSEAYRELKDELGRLTDIQMDVQQQARFLANDEAAFQGIISGLSGIAGGFSAATGAVSLFAGENENLQKIMVKVQSLMAITIGLQQVSQTLNKDSYFRLVTLVKIQDAYAAATNRVSVALGVSNVAAKALMATLTLGLSAAIGAVIYLWDKFSSSQEKAAEKAKQFVEIEKKARETMLLTCIEIKSATKEIENFTGSVEEQGEKVRELNTKYGESFGYYKTLEEWYDVLINKGNDYIQMLFKQSKAQSLIQKAIEADEKVNEIKAKDDSDYDSWWGYGGKVDRFFSNDKNYKNSPNGERLKAAALKEAEDVRDAFLKEAEEWQTGATTIQKEMANMANATVKGSISALEASISTLKDSYKKANTDVERAELLKQINEQEKMLGKMDLSKSTPNNNNLGKKDHFTLALEDRKKKYKEYFNWVNAGLQQEAQVEFASLLENGKTYKDYLQSLLDGGKLTKEQIHQVTNEIVGESNKNMLETFKTSLAEQMNNAQSVIEQLEVIRKMREELQQNADSDPLTAQKQEIVDENDKSLLEKQKEETKALLEEYATYDQQRRNIETKFNKDLAAMYDKNGNLIQGIGQENVDELKRQMTEALAMLDNEFSRTTTSIEKLFSEMSEKSVYEMRNIANEAQAMMDFIVSGQWDEEKAISFGIKTEEQFKLLNAEWSKSPEKLAAIKKAIQELNDTADKSETAFNKMAAGLKKIFSSTGQSDLEAGIKMVSSGLQSVTGMADLFSDSLRNIAELSGNETFASIADGLSQVMDVANATMQGAQAGAAFGPAGAAVGAALGLVSSVTGIFAENKKHREELKRQIAENNRQAYLGELEVNRLYRERYEWVQKIGESQLSNIKRVGEELEKQTKANATDQESLWNELMKTQYKEGEHFEKTGLFGWGKGKTVTDWASLAGKTWQDIELLAAQGKLSDEGMKYYEALKAAKQEGEDLASRQEEYLEQVRETFTGSTYDSVVNSIVDGFKAGKRSAADFASTFENLMQGAMESALQMAADEKTRKFYEKYADLASDEDGLTQADIDYLNNLWNSIIESLSEETANLEKVTGRKFGDNADTSLTGAVKGVSEETASLVAGQMNAIRINQMEATAMLRQQLFHLANIDNNTGAIDHNTRYIKDIYDKINSSDPLRSIGLS